MKVALRFNGDRAWTVTPALDAVGIEHDVNPNDVSGYDLVLIDSPGTILRDTLSSWGTPMVLRLRGDLWKERRQAGSSALRGAVIDNSVFRCLSGVIAADERLEKQARERVAVDKTGVATLPVEPNDWPTATHTDRQLRCVTLTNCDYLDKVEPLIRYSPLVNALFESIGGEWVIHGSGEYQDQLADAVGPLEHVRYGGYEPARDVLAWGNVMLHLSNFDIHCPNAMIEAAASRIPVITNGYAGFEGCGVAIRCEQWQTMKDVLKTMQEPSVRKSHADGGLAYVRRHHSPEIVGEQYADFFAEVTA